MLKKTGSKRQAMYDWQYFHSFVLNLCFLFVAWLLVRLCCLLYDELSLGERLQESLLGDSLAI
jgi:hypothetical protein